MLPTPPGRPNHVCCYVMHAPLCRRHHQVQQALWWTLTQPEPGVLTWTTPHGRSHTVTPEPYLVWPVLLPGPGVAAHLGYLACEMAYPDAGRGESGIRTLRPSFPWRSAVNKQHDIADRGGRRGGGDLPQQRWRHRCVRSRNVRERAPSRAVQRLKPNPGTVKSHDGRRYALDSRG
jgi:hypothetical protein